MAKSSTIEWTTGTWNPVTGCTKISDGCVHCYAERLARRLKGMGNPRYRNGFRVTLHRDALQEPCRWSRPQMIFVCSMSDLFHEDVPDEYISDVFKIMNQSRHHIFQVLTKRSRRLASICSSLNWSENIWAGVTVESERYISRIKDLRLVPANVRFVSLEPLLSAIPFLPLEGIDWVIVGGESGIGSRVMRPEWVTSIRDKCVKSNNPFFFKQWGGSNKKAAGKLLEGKVWNQMPASEGLITSLFAKKS